MIEGGVISLKDKTSKVALVYGQMTSPQVPEPVLLSLDSPLPSISVTRRDKTCCSLSTTSSDSPRPVPRCLPCWVVSHQLWVTSQPWPLTWVVCRRELPPPRRGPLLPYRPSTCQLMT